MFFKDLLIKKLQDDVIDIASGTIGISPYDLMKVSEVAKTAFEGAATTPDPRSVSGATSIYLNAITNDFKNFSASDAEIDIKDFIREYLSVKYLNAETINASNVGKEVLASIERSSDKETVSGIVFNKISIAGYQKSEEYATIKYQVSCGYNLSGSQGGEACRIETRYKIDYSLRFTQSDDKSALSYTCPNCNATLGIADVGECPYCGAKLVMDTLYSWYIASITEG